MGANEKHDATYHGGGYVPSNRQIRSSFTRGIRREVGLDQANRAFDRWLETVRAEAKAEAWDEGAEAEASAACINPPCGVCDGCFTPVDNPYKETV